MGTSCSSGSMSEERDWRLLMDPPGEGVWNMAVDEAILDGVATGASPPTLRFFQWRPACLSLGYFQPRTVVKAEACAPFGIGVARRPTGGCGVPPARGLTCQLPVRGA